MYCRSKDVSVIQWAPAAPGARRAVNFDVYLPAFPTSRWSAVFRSNFLKAFTTAYPGKFKEATCCPAKKWVFTSISAHYLYYYIQF